MWINQNNSFSLINWHGHFIYCMFQYCFPLSFFQQEWPNQLPLLSSYPTCRWTFIASEAEQSWDKERRSQDVTGRSCPCKNCSEPSTKPELPHMWTMRHVLVLACCWINSWWRGLIRRKCGSLMGFSLSISSVKCSAHSDRRGSGAAQPPWSLYLNPLLQCCAHL